LQAQQNIPDQAHNGGEQCHAKSGGQVAKQVLGLRRVKALDLTNLHGKHRKANHFAQKTKFELHAIDPPSGGVRAVGVFHQQVEWRATVLRIQGQGIPLFTGPALGLNHTFYTTGSCHREQISLVRQLAGTNTAPQGRDRKNNDDEQRDACGV